MQKWHLGVLTHQSVQQSYTADKIAMGQLKPWRWTLSNYPLTVPSSLAPSLSHGSTPELANLAIK